MYTASWWTSDKKKPAIVHQQQKGPNRITNFEVVESDCSSHEYSTLHCCDFSSLLVENCLFNRRMAIIEKIPNRTVI